MADWTDELPPELEPLTTKPLIAIENGPNGIDLKLEAELAELPAEEAAEFRGSGESALGEVVRRLADTLALITFFTAGEKDTRAWTLRKGQTAIEAADTIHSDIARGFIRCEVIRWDDLVARRLAHGGDARRQAAARGQDLRRRGRRRPEHPLQRVRDATWRDQVRPGRAALAAVLAVAAVAAGRQSLMAPPFIDRCLCTILRFIDESHCHPSRALLRPGTEPLDEAERESLAARFKALADPTRVAIVNRLASTEESCVCDLTAAFELSQPTISHHLKVLREAGLVESSPRGTWAYYRLKPDAVRELRQTLAARGLMREIGPRSGPFLTKQGDRSGRGA